MYNMLFAYVHMVRITNKSEMYDCLFSINNK